MLVIAAIHSLARVVRRAVSSGVEHSIHTAGVASSKLAPPTRIIGFDPDNKGQRSAGLFVFWPAYSSCEQAGSTATPAVPGAYGRLRRRDPASSSRPAAP